MQAVSQRQCTMSTHRKALMLGLKVPMGTTSTVKFKKELSSRVMMIKIAVDNNMLMKAIKNHRQKRGMRSSHP